MVNEIIQFFKFGLLPKQTEKYVSYNKSSNI